MTSIDRDSRKALFLGLKLLAIIATAELSIMIVLYMIRAEAWMSPPIVMLADTAMLSIIVSVAVVKWIVNPMKVFEVVRQSEVKYRTLFESSGDAIFIARRDGTFTDLNGAALDLLGGTREELIGVDMRSFFPDRDSHQTFMQVCERDGYVKDFPMALKTGKGLVRECVLSASVLPDHAGSAPYVQGIIRDISETTRLQHELQQASEDWQSTFNSITDMVTIHDKNFNIIRANRSAEQLLKLPSLQSLGERKCFTFYHGAEAPPDNCPSCGCLTSGESATFERFEPQLDKFIEIRAIPRLDERGSLDGLIHIVRDISDRKKGEEAVKRQLERMEALRTIDMAISSAYDLRVTLHVLLDQVLSQLKIDATDILLADQNAYMLTYAAGRGFRTKDIESTRIQVGQGMAGRAALENRAIIIHELASSGDPLTFALENEGFKAYFALPLVAKGQLKGVLELFHRTPLQPDGEWLDFLAMLAGQAAIAVDNVSMFDSQRRAHLELVMAYERTIEGWSRALDYRDRETEGHSRRVTDMTIKIARAMDISEEDLVHIRRGALLHDIGKLGVPDGILLKPGPLTDEEWKIMKRHPEIAYEILSPIAFLRPAMDIPYGHHEKWDGTGYPRGSRGEQIPLAARIFALVDVWDALSSDRPYRKAWASDKIEAHIRSLSGSHFDPNLIDVFMGTVTETVSPVR